MWCLLVKSAFKELPTDWLGTDPLRKALDKRILGGKMVGYDALWIF